MSEDEDLASLSRQAFGIYCDQVVRNAVEKNDAIRAENASLEPARDLLQRVELYKSGHDGVKLLMKKNLFDIDGEDETHLVFEVDDDTVTEFPLEEFVHLYCAISGVGIERDRLNIKSPPRLTVVSNQTAVLKISISNVVSVTGSLQSFAGTSEDLQYMIDTNQFGTYMMYLGMGVDVASPIVRLCSHEGSLDGAIFSLKTVKIYKGAVQSILDLEDSWLSLEDDGEDELDKLAKTAWGHNKTLSSVADERKSLEICNIILKAQRHLLQSVEASYPGHILHFNLEDGRLGDTEVPGWLIQPTEAPVTIPLSSISHLGFRLSHHHWGRKGFSSYGFTDNFGAMTVVYSQEIVAIFNFDESIMCMDLDNLPSGLNLIQYIGHILNTAGNSGAQTIVDGVPVPVDEGPQLTMRFRGLHIRLDVIQYRLNVLGIDSTTKVSRL